MKKINITIIIIVLLFFCSCSMQILNPFLVTEPYNENSVLSNNAYLSNLSTSIGTFTPTFDKNTFSYSMNVIDVTSCFIIPETEDPNTNIKINSIECYSGIQSQSIGLISGNNIIRDSLFTSLLSSNTFLCIAAVC